MTLTVPHQKITLDVNENCSSKILKAHQGDKGTRYVDVTLVASGQPITISNTYTAIVSASINRITKAVNNCTINNQTITIELTEVMLDTAGELLCDLSLIEGNQCITSATFTVLIQPSVIANESQVTASEEYGALIAALTSISDVAEKAEQVQGIVDDIAEIESAANLIEQVEEIKAFVDQDCLRIAYVAKGELDAVRSGSTLTVDWGTDVRVYSPLEREFYTPLNSTVSTSVEGTAKLLCLNKTNSQLEFVTYSNSALSNKNYELIDLFYGDNFANISPNILFKNVCLDECHVNRGYLTATYSDGTLSLTASNDLQIYSPKKKTFFSNFGAITAVEVSNVAKLVCLNSSTGSIVIKSFTDTDLNWGDYELIDIFHSGQFAGISSRIVFDEKSLLNLVNRVADIKTFVDQDSLRIAQIAKGELCATLSGSTLTVDWDSSVRIFSLYERTFYTPINSTISADVGSVSKLLCLNKTTSQLEFVTYSNSVLANKNYELIDIFYGNDFAGISNRILFNEIVFKKGGIISAPVFMFVSNNKVNIVCETNARGFYGNSIMNISSWSTAITIPGTGTYAVCINSTEFYLKSVTQLGIEDVAIALVYSNTVFPVDDNIFANTIPVAGLVQRDDVPFVINNHRIIGYDIEPVVTGSYIDDFGYFYKFKDVWRRNAACIGYKDKQGRILTNSNAVTKNAVDIDGKTILCIGDSVTKRGWFQDRIKTYAPNVNFVGTQSTYYSTVACEGYSGRTAQNVLNSSTIVLNDNVTTIANPFWNTLTNKIDFSYYCTNQNVHPDYVILEFGLNETNEINYAAAMRRFIQSIKDYDSDIKIYVIQPFNAVRDIGAANTTNGKQRDACDRCVLESYTFTDCTLIPAWYIMVDEYDYTISNKQYGYGNITIQQATDGVHPSETVGFAKLGDFIYNYLGESVASPSASENNITDSVQSLQMNGAVSLEYSGQTSSEQGAAVIIEEQEEENE